MNASRAGAGGADERFRVLADAAPAILWLTDPDGGCSFASRGWYDYTGQAEASALGAGRLDAVHPEDRAAADTAFAAAAAEREPFVLEYRLRRGDGAYRWASDTGRPRFGSAGEFLGYVGSIVDVTERKRSETLEEEQRRALEIVAGGAPLEECIQVVAEVAARLVPDALGAGVVVEPSRLESTPPLAVFAPAALGEALRAAAIDERECHSTPVLGRGGRVIGSFRWWPAEPRLPTEWEQRVAQFAARVAAIALEREHAAAELRESDERFRVAADAAGTAVYDVPLGVGQGVATVHGLEHILGGPIDEPLTSVWWHSLIHAEDREAHEKHVARRVADASAASYRSAYRVRHVDGSWRDVEDDARICRDAAGCATRIVGTLRDVTARKRDELELRRSREHVALLSDTVPALISYIGPDRAYVTCNAEYSKWFGLPQDEIVGRPVRDVLGEDAWRVVGPHVERTFAGEPSEYEADVEYRHGGKRSINARYTPHRGPGGEVLGIVCLVTDIAARRQAGHERARLAAIVDSSDDAIVSKDLSATITSWNKGATRLFGYSAEEAIGRPITMLIPEERHHEELRILERIRHGEAMEPLETVRRRKNGALIDVSLSVSPIVDESGRIVGASKIARDITARRRAEEDLRRSRAALNGLIDRAPFGIYIVDAELKIAQMNARSQAGSFYNVRPVIGRDLRDVMSILWPEPVATEIVGAFTHTLETGEAYRSRNFTSARADVANVESYEWELHRITLPDGRPGVVCYYFDSTRLRKAEQALREADRRKDEFLATLAHELRNPLAPIRNGLQILRVAGRDAAAAAQVQEMLERQVDHLVRLVDDLMEVARVTRGRIELRRESLDLGAMLRNAVETSRPLIEASRHELAVNLPAEPVTISADPLRIGQIVANLLNNAAKYTEPGGRISLSAGREDGFAVVAVRDNGVGIPADVLPRVFDLFAQADRTYQRAQGGLGIGLTLVRTLVELHGGTVAARSEGLGRGSEFVVRLPIGGETGYAHDDAPKGRDGIFASHRILVVDDSLDAAESLALLLGGFGADVRTATDGPGALDELDAFRPSVVLLDIGMPGMDGLEVARRARRRPDGADLTVIALSGWGQDEDRRRSREAGIDYHLVKPIDVDELGRLLTALAPARAHRLRHN